MKNEAYSRTARAVTSALLLFALTSAAFGQSVTPSEQILHAFAGGNDGGVPYSTLVQDRHGNFFGTASQYGGGPCSVPNIGCGIVFELSRSDDHPANWAFSVLYTFQGGADGNLPASKLTIDDSGNLYGTTVNGGGAGCGLYGCGTVFELSPTAGIWQESILYRFAGETDGNDPLGSVVLDRVGNLYGAAAFGGNGNCFYEGVGCGVVFQLRRPPNKASAWKETILHTFTGDDGADPFSGVIIDAEGNIYGVTEQGGIGDPHTESGGVVFELRRTQSGWIESTLLEFPKNSGNPGAPLTLDKQGNLYGTTEHGGSYGLGSVFELTKLYADHGLSGSPNVAFPPLWKETDLYSFTGGADGGNPLYSGVVFDKGGNLYGTTEAGGSNPNCETNCGVIFQLTKGSGNVWQESEVFSFSGGADGFYPFSGVIVGKDGLYGMTPNGGDPSCSAFSLPGCGVIYRISK